ncbi:hypothetical protein Efla_003429 [Eimeria flavescens]
MTAEAGGSGLRSAASRLSAAPQTFNNFYKTRMCERKLCAWGAMCNFAHSAAELRPFYDLTRTKMCPQQTAAGGCRTAGCRFAHSSSELRATEVFYKTQLCIAFAAGGPCANGSNCRHAHGQQELRPRPLPLYTVHEPGKAARSQKRQRAARKQRRQQQQTTPSTLPPNGVSPHSEEGLTRLIQCPSDQWTTASASESFSPPISSYAELPPPPGLAVSIQQHREKLERMRLSPQTLQLASPFLSPSLSPQQQTSKPAEEALEKQQLLQHQHLQQQQLLQQQQQQEPHASSAALTKGKKQQQQQQQEGQREAQLEKRRSA